MKNLSILFLCSIVFTLTSCQDDHPDLEDGLYAEFVTNKGSFIAELYYEATPMTVGSFVSLAEGESDMAEDDFQDKKFYDGLKFHRVIEDFMIQGGDPTGTGSGGPGYEFPNEIVDTLRHDSKGILSMANSGPDTNGSQFFITLQETPWLDGMHTVFGKVISGMDVVDSIGATETGEGDRPVEDVVMEEVNIIREGSDARNFDGAEVLNQELETAEAEAQEQEERMAEQKQARVDEFEALEEEAEELPSGLKIYFNEEAGGEKPNNGDIVLVNYAGFLRDGEVFDTNRVELAREAGIFNPARLEQGGYEPTPMPYSPEAQLIPGFREGLQQMSIGDKATLFIPSHLGYGETGAAPVIPPNTDLVFVVELVGVQE